MYDIRPHIKPKAPNTLKQNILKAIREQEAGTGSSLRIKRHEHPNHRRMGLYAASALLAIMLAYSLWPTENDDGPGRLTQATQEHIEKTPSGIKHATQAASLPFNPSKAETARSKKPLRLHTPKQGRTHPLEEEHMPLICQNAPDMLAKHNERHQASNEHRGNEQSETNATASPPEEPVNEQPITEYLTDKEKTLIEEFRKKEYHVRAFLADELIQASERQARLLQSHSSYRIGYRPRPKNIKQAIHSKSDKPKSLPI